MRHIYSANGDIVKTVETKDGKTVLGSHQDVEPYLRQSEAERSAGHNGFTQSRTMRKIADIPLNMILTWMNEDGVNYFQLGAQEKRKWIMRKIRENPKFMTVNGGI